MKTKAYVIVFWNEKRDAPEMCQVKATRQEADSWLSALVKREASKQGQALNNEDTARADINNYMIREFDIER